jgi:hypothetical protein
VSALDAALFVSDAIHKREITLGDGTKHELHFREISSGDLLKLQSANEREAFAAGSRVIARSLCTADGKDAISVEDAARLKHGIRLALAVAIAEVNGIGSTVGKVSPHEETTGSGTSSSSMESADAPSPRPSGD